MANKTLSDTIAKMEAKNNQLQGKLHDAKVYQRVFKHSQAMHCKFCEAFFASEVFIEHVSTCNKDSKASRNNYFTMPLVV